eukprot:m.259082 g.259082  ORF g.259082 m.259082 type:complete len:312 (+) comp37560_c0_seq1:172-1107(+)
MNRYGGSEYGDRSGGGGGGGGFQRNGPEQMPPEFWIERREERSSAYKKQLRGIWGESPRSDLEHEEAAELLAESKSTKKKKKKKSKRVESSSDSSSSDSSDDSSDSSEDDRKRKKKGSKRKSRKSSKSSKRSSKKKKKVESSSSESSSSSSSGSSSSSSGDDEEDGDEWVAATVAPMEDDGLLIGPRAPQTTQAFNSVTTDFGGALMPGEGDAMANFVADGKRIPRRGEIGLDPEEIESFEDQGFVMSGSRHRRMEAVRIRKENQIYTADERRALAMFHYEEQQKKENKIVAELRDLVKAQKKGAARVENA